MTKRTLKNSKAELKKTPTKTTFKTTKDTAQEIGRVISQRAEKVANILLEKNPSSPEPKSARVVTETSKMGGEVLKKIKKKCEGFKTQQLLKSSCFRLGYFTRKGLNGCYSLIDDLME